MEKQYAIMFADVAGSTRMYDTLGDAEAEKQIAWCIQTMTDTTNRHGGRVIKTIGDEIMACFDSADDAAEAAIDMQTNISGDHSNDLNIRIGMQYGTAIDRDGDLYGDAVNVAARMAGVAKALQIITTKDLVDQLNPELASKSRLFDRTTVKGKFAELDIHQINWEEETKVTQFAFTQDIQKASTAKQTIVLKTAGKESIYTDEDLNPAISIGKDPSCTITLDAQFASRSHASLESRRGKFVLLDSSTNGTYVRFKDQDDIFIRREELTLLGDGLISLGEAVTPNSPAIISFSVLQTK